MKKRAARRKLVVIKQAIQEKRQDLRETKQAQRRIFEQIRENQEGLDGARSRLRDIRGRLGKAERDLKVSHRRLEVAKAKLTRHVRQVRGRLVDIYKHGSVGYASVLLQARDMWDLTSRGFMLQRVVNYDKDLLDRIRDEKAEVAAQTARIRSRRNEVAQLRLAAEGQIHEVSRRLERQHDIEEELSRDRAQLESALAELEENSRQVEQMLRAFEAQPDIARRIPKPWTGGFRHPVAGRITSRFGMRFHPILRVTKLHTGVDFAAGTGTPIHAAGDGVVVHAGWWGGYGNCVVIAHGNGRSTLYGHCSSVHVSSGQKVRRGEVIAAVGCTGYSTGPHLHFEVRRNGVPVNPMR